MRRSLATARAAFALPACVLLVACTRLVGRADLTDASADGADGGDDGAVTASMDGALDDARSSVTCAVAASERSGQPDPTLSERRAPVGFPTFHSKGARQDAEGRFYVYGSRIDCARPGSNHDGFVARFDAEGQPDVTFGNRGWACVDLGRSAAEVFFGMDIDPWGRPVLVGASVTETPSALVARFTAEGLPDMTFGEGGVRDYGLPGAPRQPVYAYAVVAETDGLVIAGADHDPYNAPSLGFALRLLGNGAIDPSFHDGVAWVDRTTSGYSALARTRAGYALAGQSQPGFQPRVVMLDRGGALVEGFGVNGVATHRAAGLRVRGLSVTPQGAFVLAGGAATPPAGPVTLVRFDARGRPDLLFGEAGAFVGPVAYDASYSLQPSLASRCDGRIFVSSGNADGVALLALTERGALDADFGDGGAVRIFAGAARATLVDPRDGRVTVVFGVSVATGDVVGFERFLP
ncbi:MAG: hypothetical protein R3A52_27705 [Polyangiales bacterium]